MTISNLFDKLGSQQTGSWWQSWNFPAPPDFEAKNLTKFVKSALFFRALASKQTVLDYSSHLMVNNDNLGTIAAGIVGLGYSLVYHQENDAAILYFFSTDNSVVCLNREAGSPRANFNVISIDMTLFDKSKKYFENLN